MICANCGTDSHHIKVTEQGESCHNCGGFAETSGKATQNTITRNSFRVREQQQHYEGDMQPPFRYNHETRRAEPNPEFVRLFPDKAKDHYTPDQLRGAGMTKLAKKIEKQSTTVKPDKGVKFKGDTKKGIERAINATAN